eukprot:6018098-Prymnesium_polylepis.1
MGGGPAQWRLRVDSEEVLATQYVKTAFGGEGSGRKCPSSSCRCRRTGQKLASSGRRARGATCGTRTTR